jgi:hypothetical protein
MEIYLKKERSPSSPLCIKPFLTTLVAISLSEGVNQNLGKLYSYDHM